MDERLQALSLAFWTQVMEDLLSQDILTYVWLVDTGHELTGFLWWCEASNKKPEEWQAYLLRLWSIRGTDEAKRALKKLRENRE